MREGKRFVLRNPALAPTAMCRCNQMISNMCILIFKTRMSDENEVRMQWPLHGAVKDEQVVTSETPSSNRTRAARFQQLMTFSCPETFQPSLAKDFLSRFRSIRSAGVAPRRVGKKRKVVRYLVRNSSVFKCMHVAISSPALSLYDMRRIFI